MADIISQQGLYQDGNSIFENVHILGTLEVTGIVKSETNLTSTGSITASKFIGDGSELSGIDATTIKDSAGTTQIQGTTTGATHSGKAVFDELEIGGKLYDGDGDFGTSGQVLASDGTNTNWVNTGSLTAGAASEVGVTAVNTDSDHFIAFVDSSSGNENIKVDTDLKYNPSSNTIATIKINDLQLVGQLKDGDNAFGSSGQVLSSDGTDTAWVNAGSLTAGAAAEVGVTATNTTNSTHFLTFVEASSGNEEIRVDTGLTYNPSSDTITATTFSGTATQAANLNNHDTDDLGEGSSNLYFTDGRARAAISIGAEGSASGNGSISYNNSTGVLTFTPAAAVGTPSAITVADESSDTTCFPLFATAATGDLSPKTGSNLTFNSVDGILGATAFSGGGAGLTSLNADNLGSGTLPSARFSGSYGNTVTIGDVRIGAWTGGATYKGIFHTNQSSAEYMIMSADTHTFISATTGHNVYIRNGGNDGTNQLIIGSGNDALTWRGNKVIHAGNYGELLRSDADDTATGRIVFTKNDVSNYDTIATSTGSQGAIEIYNGGAGNDAFMTFHTGGDFAMYFGLDADNNSLSVGGWSMGANKYKIWHEGNDGSGSGLDADNLDGRTWSESEGGSTIVSRNSSGHVFANYYNGSGTFATNANTSGMARFTGTNGSDTYGRSYTAAAARALLNVADGATNTPNITNNNQISNGAGYITGTDIRSMDEAASTGVTQTNSSQYQNKVTVTVSTASNTRVLVFFGFAHEHSDDDNNQSVFTQVTNSNGNFVGGNPTFSNSGDYERVEGQRLDISSHSGTRTYYLQFRSGNQTSRIKDAYLVAIAFNV